MFPPSGPAFDSTGASIRPPHRGRGRPPPPTKRTLCRSPRRNAGGSPRSARSAAAAGRSPSPPARPGGGSSAAAQGNCAGPRSRGQQRSTARGHRPRLPSQRGPVPPPPPQHGSRAADRVRRVPYRAAGSPSRACPPLRHPGVGRVGRMRSRFRDVWKKRDGRSRFPVKWEGSGTNRSARYSVRTVSLRLTLRSTGFK